MKRPKNYCPKEMAGIYTVAISENKVVISEDFGEKSAVVKCCPEDTFDIGEAMRIGMKRMFEQEIKVNDEVKVVDNGYTYCTYTSWPEEFSEFACRYRFGVIPSTDTVYKVVAKFASITNEELYVIQPVLSEKIYGDNKYKTLDCRGVYLISERGLKKVNKYEA